jgi:alkylated DNA repair dioxygenase AlkB
MADAQTTTERVWLDERSWVDVVRGWLPDADEVFAAVLERAEWFQGRVYRYERYVEEPRLSASSRTGLAELHPGLVAAHRTIRREYGVDFARPALGLYRDGRDSVAFHSDRELRWLEDTVIGVLTLGAQRPWLLRPKARRYDHEAAHHGATHDIRPASGDLLVMGGRCQADWDHAVPKVPASIGPRVSLQWRWTSRKGRPVVGPNYRAARTYSR